VCDLTVNSKRLAAVCERQAASTQTDAMGESHRAEAAQLAHLDACPSQLGGQEGTVERCVVSDDDATGQSIEHVAQHFRELGCSPQIAAAHSVNIRRPKVPVRIEQRHPSVAPTTFAINGDQCQLDDAMVRTRTTSRRLAVDDDERAVAKLHGAAGYTSTLHDEPV
jgi:hypothetical protein